MTPPKHVDIYDAAWRKASRSVNNGQCVEVGATSATILVRDSVDPAGPTLSYPSRAWQAFLTTAKFGAFGAIR
jgi:hypothetical protein